LESFFPPCCAIGFHGTTVMAALLMYLEPTPTLLNPGKGSWISEAASTLQNRYTKHYPGWTHFNVQANVEIKITSEKETNGVI